LSNLAEGLNAIAKRALENVKPNFLIGLGSGSTVAVFTNALREFVREKRMEVRVIPSSTQIQLACEAAGLQLAAPSLTPYIDLTVDGADQIDKRFNMIKGGGGALFRERILISSAKKNVILADESKFVNVLDMPVPIEVHPFGRAFVEHRLKSLGRKPHLRLEDKGYPFFTENGNVIFDTDFGLVEKPAELRTELRALPGVIEVGLFDEKVAAFYRARNDGSVDVIRP